MTDNRIHLVTASDIESKEPPRCPGCGNAMSYYGGRAGWVCCEFKILFRQSGWFDAKGRHVFDNRLAGGDQRVDEVIKEQ